MRWLRKVLLALNIDAWPLYGFLAAAGLLVAFGHIAEEVIEGDSAAFDRNILLALRIAGDPSMPIGPIWLQEAARDLTALGSVLVLSLLTAGAAGYLFLIELQKNNVVDGGNRPLENPSTGTRT